MENKKAECVFAFGLAVFGLRCRSFSRIAVAQSSLSAKPWTIGGTPWRGPDGPEWMVFFFSVGSVETSMFEPDKAWGVPDGKFFNEKMRLRKGVATFS